jgi:hypothetical protein
MSERNLRSTIELARGTQPHYIAGKLMHIATRTELTEVEAAFLIVAAERMGVDTFPSQASLERVPVAKGTLAERLYPEAEGHRVDCAIPQQWLDTARKRLHDMGLEGMTPGGLQSHFVTVYSKESLFPTVKPVTRQGVEVLAALVGAAL